MLSLVYNEETLVSVGSFGWEDTSCGSEGNFVLFGADLFAPSYSACILCSSAVGVQMVESRGRLRLSAHSC